MTPYCARCSYNQTNERRLRRSFALAIASAYLYLGKYLNYVLSRSELVLATSGCAAVPAQLPVRAQPYAAAAVGAAGVVSEPAAGRAPPQPAAPRRVLPAAARGQVRGGRAGRVTRAAAPARAGAAGSPVAASRRANALTAARADGRATHYRLLNSGAYFYDAYTQLSVILIVRG